MSQVNCPNCARGIKLIPKLYGRKVECKCGTVFRMPKGPVSEPAPIPVEAVATASIPFNCPSCGQRLEVDAAHAGKLSECPCGTRIRVPELNTSSLNTAIPVEAMPLPSAPSSSAAAPPPVINSPPLINDPLGTPLADPLGQFGASPSNDVFDDYALTPMESQGQPNYLQPNKRKKKSNTREKFESTRRRKAQHREEEKSASAELIGGIAAMVGAVVWFVAGYMAGYIFFYPPILFFIGLAGVIKGLTKL